MKDATNKTEAPVQMGGTGSGDLLERPGSYYQAIVPDTLDLAERGHLAMGHFLSIIDEDNDYEMYWGGNATRMWHWMSDFMCHGKAFEAMLMLRIMTGNREGLKREAGFVDLITSVLGDDGLYWVPQTGGRKPWLGPEEMRPYVHLHAQPRVMRAMITAYQYTGDPIWKERIDRMVDGYDRVLAVHKNDYAYFPAIGWMDEEYMRSCYVKDRGWKDISEPESEKGGEETSLFNQQGHYPGALANWYLLTGNKDALRLAGELVRFYTQPKFWADWKGGEYRGVAGAEHAHWDGHFHGHLNTLRAVLEYAIATNDPYLKSFVREGYEWTRQPALARFGFGGDCQGCGCGRLIGLAVKLSYAGIGDYWEDVDTYIRNMGTEMQHMPEDFPTQPDAPQAQGNREKIGPREAIVGGFASLADKVHWALCCSPHGTMGLFYAWDGTLRYHDGVARVNLLLNRASPWMDMDSYLPFAGKVVLRNKACREAFVRIPLWVEQGSVSCRVGDRTVRPTWFGRYIRLEHLKAGDVITMEFPVEERTERWTGVSAEAWSQITNELQEYISAEQRRGVQNELWNADHGIHYFWSPRPVADAPTTFTLKANTIVGISQPILPDSPLFLGRAEKYQASHARMKEVERFTTPLVLKW